MLACVLALFGCSREEPKKVIVDDYVFAPVKQACRAIERLESATAVTNGLVFREIDVAGLSAADFRRILLEVPGRDVHVWMPGLTHWLLVGHADTNRVSLAQAMDVLATDDDCESLPLLFANYAGTRDEMLPAFRSRLVGEVVPEWFLTKEIPPLDWLDTAGVEPDILDVTRREIRTMQVVRRLVLEGNMLAAKANDKKSEEKATETWARACLRNPRDLMLLERIDRLERNANGFLAVGKVLQAMKCYETIILIQPKNASAVRNFGLCLKRIGKLDLAKTVLEKAASLAKEARER